MHSDSFLCFRQTAQQVQFGNPKTLLSIHNQAKEEVTKVQSVSVCVSFYQPAMSCASLQFLLFFSSWSCFLFLLLFMSVLMCLAAVQVLVVGCFRKCTWLSWEVRWAICPQATPSLDPPLLPIFFFNKFYQLLTGSKAPLCTEVGARALLLCLIHAEK